jgi:THO complex subunit 2
MLFFMHRTGVPGFRLLKFLDRLFITERLTPLICSMSEEEVKCFGRFLKNILTELLRWHQNEKVFNKFAHGENKELRGFAMSADAGAKLMAYEQFRILHYKWHDQLFRTLKDSLETKQYTEVRNSIFVLKDVSPAFPKIDGMAVELRTQIEGFAQEDERDDIKVAANSILADFKRGAKLWKTKAAFRVCTRC